MALIPLAISRAAEIDVVIALIADQSMFLPALPLAINGCVGTPIVAKQGAGTPYSKED